MDEIFALIYEKRGEVFFFFFVKTKELGYFTT